MNNGKSELYIYNPSQEGDVKVENDPNDIIMKRLDNIERSIGGIYESISGNARNTASNEKSNRSNADANASKDAKTESTKIQ